MKLQHLFLGFVLSCGLLYLPLTAGAEEADAPGTGENRLTRPSEHVQYNEAGQAFFSDNGTVLTGRFAAVPEYLMGDVNADAVVDALDAAAILTASSYAGAFGTHAEDMLTDGDTIPDAAAALLYADINEDGEINALDAASILTYSAKLGSGAASDRLGTLHYFADADGILQTGWIRDGEDRYYANENYTLCTDWLTLDGAHYRFDAQGLLQTGWLTEAQSVYYLDETTGAAVTGWAEIGEDTYYFDADGRMVTGWTEIGGADYYFGADGKIASGWTETGSGTYYFGADGQAVTGWQTRDGKTYYFDEAGLLAEGWQDIGGERYHFSREDGMATGWFTEYGKWYYFGEDGAEQFGWLLLGDERFYLGEDGARLVSWQVIDGHTYYFSGVYGHASSGWAKMNQGWFYFDEENIMATGWLTLDGKTYYMGDDGIRRSGWQTIDGVKYYFDSSGVLASGWVSINGSRYYFTSEGTAVTGWQTIDGNRYYFAADGVMAVNQAIGDLWLGEDGIAVSALYHTNKVRADSAFAQYGTSVSGIYNYVRATTRYKKIESTKTLAQIEKLGWLYFVDYSMTHYYGVCYYLAAKTDFLLQEAGYTCRIVHATHGSGDHYWNQVLVNGTWVNYDLTNNLYAKTWSQMVAYGNYTLIGYVTPKYA